MTRDFQKYRLQYWTWLTSCKLHVVSSRFSIWFPWTFWRLKTGIYSISLTKDKRPAKDRFITIVRTCIDWYQFKFANTIDNIQFKSLTFTVATIPKVLNQEKMEFILPLFFICLTRASRPVPGQGFIGGLSFTCTNIFEWFDRRTVCNIYQVPVDSCCRPITRKYFRTSRIWQSADAGICLAHRRSDQWFSLWLDGRAIWQVLSRSRSGCQRLRRWLRKKLRILIIPFHYL